MCRPRLAPRTSRSATFPANLLGYAEWNPRTLRCRLGSYIRHVTERSLVSRNNGKVQCCANFSLCWSHIYERRKSEDTSNRTALISSFLPPSPPPPPSPHTSSLTRCWRSLEFRVPSLMYIAPMFTQRCCTDMHDFWLSTAELGVEFDFGPCRSNRCVF
jgi:hypothetical protein